MSRCPWCGSDPVYVAYHDTEWGVPEYDSRALFEKLVLDGFQAGLSWITILKKRDNFRRVFEGFDPCALAGWTQADVQSALSDPGIVRHRGKIEAAMLNAQAWQRIEAREGFSAWVWSFVDGAPIVNRFQTQAAVPTETNLSQILSKSLKKEGFKFCGPVITYAFMEAVGLVNDHLTCCHRHPDNR